MRVQAYSSQFQQGFSRLTGPKPNQDPQDTFQSGQPEFVCLRKALASGAMLTSMATGAITGAVAFGGATEQGAQLLQHGVSLSALSGLGSGTALFCAVGAVVGGLLAATGAAPLARVIQGK